MLQGMVALVTGGASGLGLGTVQRFVKQGAKVVIADLPSSKGKEVADELGSSAIFAPTDVTSEQDVHAALNATKRHFNKLDVLVNAAGIGFASRVFNFNRGVPHTFDDFSKVFKVNAGGTFNCVRLAVELMYKNEPNEDGQRGVVINTASVAAFDGQIGQAAYSASKGAITSMTLPLARDLVKAGIRVVTIAPGIMDTPLFKALPPKAVLLLQQSVPFPSRLGKPDEFAQLAQHIVENSYLNGEVIRLDGALRMQA
ncbi:3-hydroxyacyl-CoA dehydrogenase type-2-like [Nomia melanderi]|uniref:3-hydroxyacyl-CoA dehydrogenase type-2-like n=1 Tax=Nomia melanderi TaxID=2448451 RepID=UPI0013045BAC|nr:3-hydroxyacyl-CoA dehydrogenase type-2-like [Nomia melanderi]